jgi:hypothetical protein
MVVQSLSTLLLGFIARESNNDGIQLTILLSTRLQRSGGWGCDITAVRKNIAERDCP